jgi:hypothetical protein
MLISFLDCYAVWILGDVSDVSEVHAVSNSKVEVCLVDEFLWLYRIMFRKKQRSGQGE